jgi:hypothetical protein
MKLKRYNMKKILADPKLRRELIIQSTIATQAREGIIVTREEAESSYDEVMKETGARHSPGPSSRNKQDII